LLDIYWNILTMHVLINVKSPNNISKWQMGFNSAFKGLMFKDSMFSPQSVFEYFFMDLRTNGKDFRIRH
jgi:hypothetical protein